MLAQAENNKNEKAWMNTDIAELAGFFLQRVSFAVLIAAAFLSAAFAAILPNSEAASAWRESKSIRSPLRAERAYHYPPTVATAVTHSESFEQRLSAEFAGLAMHPNEAVPTSFATDGTRHFWRSYLNGVDNHQWTSAVSTHTITSAVAESNTLVAPRYFGNLPYPNIRMAAKPSGLRFKPVIAYRSVATGNAEKSEPIPAVRCMGLSPVAVAKRADRYDALIQRYSMNYGISANLVRAVITKESCFNPTAKSYVGATGLMQLMPETATWLKVDDFENPEQNLEGGVRYLASLYQRFGRVDLTLAAYNAGPGNVERHGGIPPFNETQDYVKSVLSHYRFYSATARFKLQLALN